MKLIADKFEGKKESFYRKNNYQAFIAARLISDKGKRVALKLGAG